MTSPIYAISMLMNEPLTDLQRSIVEAPCEGEIVVGGAAGSGKTTAAIHRAAYLCTHTSPRSREPTVLFLCYNRPLEATIRQRVATFPSRVSSHVKVRTVHSVCWPYVQHQLPGFTVLDGDQKRLALLREAIQAARYMYGDIEVFEAQDLSHLQIALARSIARQSLMLIADQSQMIYRITRLPESLPAPEDYDVVLHESMRTTAAIFAYARRLLPEGDPSVLPERDGSSPVYLPFRWSDEEAEAGADLVKHLLADGAIAETIGVLARYRDLLKPLAAALQARGIAAVIEHGATDEPGVRLTTIHSAKGREFAAVIVIGLVEGVLPGIRPDMDRVAVSQELALSRRLLYVAMTRACHQLWLTSSEGRPSRLLAELGLREPSTVRQ